MCIFCNIQSSKTTVKLSENSWNKRRCKRFQRRDLWRQRLYCYRFFFCCSTGIRYQKSYILVSDRI